jgi:hypothetical protein
MAAPFFTCSGEKPSCAPALAETASAIVQHIAYHFVFNRMKQTSFS